MSPCSEIDISPASIENDGKRDMKYTWSLEKPLSG